MDLYWGGKIHCVSFQGSIFIVLELNPQEERWKEARVGWWF